MRPVFPVEIFITSITPTGLTAITFITPTGLITPDLKAGPARLDALTEAQ